MPENSWYEKKLKASQETDPKEKFRGDNGVDLSTEDDAALDAAWAKVAKDDSSPS